MSSDLSLYLNWSNAIALLTHLGFAFFLSIILFFAHSNIGKKAFLIAPLILWQVLWQSWNGVRNQLFFDFIYGSDINPETYIQIYFFYSRCSLLWINFAGSFPSDNESSPKTP